MVSRLRRRREGLRRRRSRSTTRARTRRASPTASGSNFEANGGTVNAEESINSADKDFKSLLDHDRAERARHDLRPGLQPGVRVDREAARPDERPREHDPDRIRRLLGRSTYTEIAAPRSTGCSFRSGPVGVLGRAFYKRRVPACLRRGLTGRSRHPSSTPTRSMRSTSSRIAIEDVAIENDDGSVTIPSALNDALFARACAEHGELRGRHRHPDDAPGRRLRHAVTIGVYEVPDVPVP